MAGISTIPIVWLPSATSPTIKDPHRYFVKHPVMPGAQPAVIEVWRNGNVVDFSGELVVLPLRVPYEEPVTKPVYSACIKVMKMDYEAVINRANRPEADDIAEWSARSWEEPPFTTISQGQTKEHLFGLLRAVCAAKLPGGETVEDVVEKIKAASVWTPYHLADRARAKHSEEHWRILRNWDRWEQREYDWTRRYLDANPDKRSELPKAISDGAERMRKVCSWMGLTNIKSRLSGADRVKRKLERARNR